MAAVETAPRYFSRGVAVPVSLSELIIRIAPWYYFRMTQLAVRLDDKTEMALDKLTSRTGQRRSQVIRDALVAYERAELLTRMRSESIALRSDSEDLREAQIVASEMRARRAW